MRISLGLFKEQASEIEKKFQPGTATFQRRTGGDVIQVYDRSAIPESAIDLPDSGPLFVRIMSSYLDRVGRHDCDKAEVSYFLQAILMDMGHQFVLPEFPCGNCYMDFVALDSQLSEVVEFEFKVSRSDYLADFKKMYLQDEIVGNKHVLLQAGSLVTNRFYFVMPEGLIHFRELPLHCGLIFFRKTCLKTPGGAYPGISFHVVERAPILHMNRPDEALLQKLVVAQGKRIHQIMLGLAGLSKYATDYRYNPPSLFNV